MIDLVLLGLLPLRTRSLRALLSALGIAIGIATMVVVTAIPAASQRALDRQLAALGTNLLLAQPVPDAIAPVLLPEQAVPRIGRIAEVQRVGAVGNTHAPIGRSDLVPEDDSAGISVLASTGDLLGTLSGAMYSGAFLGPATENLPAVVLGSKAAARLGVTEVHAGRDPIQLWIGRHWFTVIGVLAPLPLAPELDRAVLVGWPEALTRLGFDGHPTAVYLRARESALDDVRSVVPGTLSPQTSGVGVLVSQPSDALAAKQLTENALSTLLLALTGVALLVGGVGVANTMVISVLERRREIGLRRALGASRGHLGTQFVVESVILCVIGGCGGTLLGVLAADAYATWRGWPPVVPLAAVLGGLALAAGLGVVAGAYPALRAARIPPAQALAAA